MANNLVQVSVDEIVESFSVPTVVVNRFLVTTQPDHFRIAFGEVATDQQPISYRMAIRLTPWEAQELKRVLETLLEPFEADMALKKAMGQGHGGNE
jgi:hypothetical protein